MICIGLLLPSKVQLLRKGTSGYKAICSHDCWRIRTVFHSQFSYQTCWSAFFWIVRPSSTHFPYEKHVAGHVGSGSSTPRLSQVRVQLPKLSSGEQAAETRQLRKKVELNNGLLWSFLTARLWKSWKIYVALLRLIIFFEIFERRSNSMTVLCKSCRSWAAGLHILFHIHHIRTTNVSSQSAAQIIQAYHWRIDLPSWSAIEKQAGGISVTH
jgi:hypothetical protein